MSHEKTEREAMRTLDVQELAGVEGGVMDCRPPKCTIYMPKLPGPTCPSPFPSPLPSWVRQMM